MVIKVNPLGEFCPATTPASWNESLQGRRVFPQRIDTEEIKISRPCSPGHDGTSSVTLLHLSYGTSNRLWLTRKLRERSLRREAGQFQLQCHLRGATAMPQNTEVLELCLR